MFQWLCAFVRSFLLTAKDHGHAPLGIELDDHVGALVGDPDVVVLVDLHRVRKRPRIEVMPDLTYELSLRTKLQKLRGACSVRGTSCLATREDENVSLRIKRYSG